MYAWAYWSNWNNITQLFFPNESNWHLNPLLTVSNISLMYAPQSTIRILKRGKWPCQYYRFSFGVQCNVIISLGFKGKNICAEYQMPNISSWTFLILLSSGKIWTWIWYIIILEYLRLCVRVRIRLFGYLAKCLRVLRGYRICEVLN